MRLLNAKTKKLEEFFEKDVPSYAILSHKWGQHEVLFKDVMKGRYNDDSDKIEGCCRQALRNGLDYIWIDTCCIDKRSSAELSEAINSMFNWYERAKVCYAYLDDVDDMIDLHVPESTLTFRESKWWTRGWTLQELLAPRHVEFYSASWTLLGEKLWSHELDSPAAGSINGLITEITGINTKYLNNYYNCYDASVAEKMSWVAFRQTTRVEDIAYSLLGIFEVNMPLLYGEKEGAFLRLQKAIISSSDDQSIFAAQILSSSGSLFASSPSDFAGYADMMRSTPDWAGISHFSMTNAGLQISMRLRMIPGSDKAFIGLLNCARRNNEGSRNIAITLIQSPEHTGKVTMAGPFIRCCKYPISIPLSLFQVPYNDPDIPIYIRPEHVLRAQSGLMFTTSNVSGGISIKALEVYPPHWESIIDEGYFSDLSGVINSRDIGKEKKDKQIIYLHCLMGTGESFVVRLNYGFRIPRFKFRMYPSTLKFEVAPLESGLSLAEAMIMYEGRIDMSLDWHRQVDLNDGILTFSIVKEDQGDSPRPWWILRPQIIRRSAEEGGQVPPKMKRQRLI